MAARRGARTSRRLEGWHGIGTYPDARQLPGIVVYRWEAPLFFANAGAFRTQIRHIARDARPAWIVLQCEAITDIDVTARRHAQAPRRRAQRQGIHVAFAELRDRLQELIEDYGLLDTLDRDHFYPTLDAALAAIRALGTNDDATEQP